MKHFFMKILPAVFIIMCLSACGKFETNNDKIAASKQPTETELTEPSIDSGEKAGVVSLSPSEMEKQNGQIEYIKKVPSKYYSKCKNMGKVEKVNYESRDYMSDEKREIKKTAFVYKPFGYNQNDINKKYNILYLLHGWKMTAGDFFDDSKSDIVNILDNMIEAGEIEPLIVVSATFDMDNKPQSLKKSAMQVAVFHKELRNDLIPYIEKHYNSYAEDTTEEQLKASRGHRAFGGFSLGAITTWHQFIHNLDYIKYFVPMSGGCLIDAKDGVIYRSVETADYIEDIMGIGKWNKNDYRIYQGIGTSDSVWKQIDRQIREMMKREMFTQDNFHYSIIKGGKHNIDACEQFLYYALKDFFG